MSEPRLPRYETTPLRLVVMAAGCTILSSVAFHVMQSPCGREMTSAPMGRYDGPIYVIKAHGFGGMSHGEVIRHQYIYYVCAAAAFLVGGGLGLAALARRWTYVGVAVGAAISSVTVVLSSWVLVWGADAGPGFVVISVPLVIAVLALCRRREPLVPALTKTAFAALAAMVLYYLGVMALWWLVYMILGAVGLLDSGADSGPLHLAGAGDGSAIMFGVFAGYHTFASGYLLAVVGQESRRDTGVRLLWPFRHGLWWSGTKGCHPTGPDAEVADAGNG